MSEEIGPCVPPGPLAVAPGAHVCALADDADVRATLVADWIRAGLEASEHVTWLAPDAGVFDWLSAHEVAWERPHERGQLSLLPPSELLRLESRTGIPACLDRAASLTAQATAAGYTGLRIGAEAANALAVMPDVATQLELEAAWERHTLATGMSFLCVYDSGVYGEALGTAVQRHPRCLTDGLATVVVEHGAVRVEGEIDVSNADLAGDHLEGVMNADVVLDLSGLSFIDVRGTNRLVALSRSLGPSGGLRVSAPSKALNRVLEVGGWPVELDLTGGHAG